MLQFYTGDTAGQLKKVIYTPGEEFKAMKQNRRDVYAHQENQTNKGDKETNDGKPEEEEKSDKAVTIETLQPMQKGSKILKMFWYQLSDVNIMKHFNKKGYCERLIWIIREGEVVELFDVEYRRIVFRFKKDRESSIDEDSSEVEDEKNTNLTEKNGTKTNKKDKDLFKVEKIKTCKQLNDEKLFKETNLIGMMQIENKVYLCNNLGILTQIDFQSTAEEDFEFKGLKLVATITKHQLYSNSVCTLRVLVQNPYKPHEFAVGGLDLNVKIFDINNLSKPVFAVKNTNYASMDLNRPVDVASVTFLPFKKSTTNNRLIVTYMDGTVRHFLQPQKKVARLEEFDKPAVVSILSPEEKCFITGFNDGTVKRTPIDSEDKLYLCDFIGLTGGVTDLKSIEYNGENLLISTSQDRFLRVHYNLEQYKTLVKRIWLKVAPTCVLPSTFDTDLHPANGNEGEFASDLEDEDSPEKDWNDMKEAKRIKF